MAHGDYYAAHLGLIHQRIEAYDKYGDFDPLTWILIDEQIHSIFDEGKISIGQFQQLHGTIENVLRMGATLLGWGR